MTKAQDKLKMHVFRCAQDVSKNDPRIDHHMDTILNVMDGQRSLASIAFLSGMNMSDFQKAVKSLIELELIIPVETAEVLSE